MGKVILEYKNGQLESFKCKSEERAKQIAGKRPSVKKWDYYGAEEVILRRKKKKEVEKLPATLEELGMMLRTRGIF